MRISDWSSDVCSSDLPAIPAPAYIAPQRHLTVCARAWFASPMAALAATARADVPIATCGLDTPTRYTINGTARIEPPPPTSPNNKPTSEPESSPSKYCSGSSTVSDGLLQLLDRLRLDQPLVPLRSE